MSKCTRGSGRRRRQTRALRAAGVIAVLATLALACAAGAAASLRPIELSVEGGEVNWHPSAVFSLGWRNPPGVAAVHYRLLDPAGKVVRAEKRLDWPATMIPAIGVPGPPGAYTVEVWLEDGGGVSGEPATAKLRFDDTPPGHVEPQPVAVWIGRTAFPYAIRLGHPAAPAPLAGIRGYAVSVDREAGGSPCADRVCSEAEIDLRGGTGDDRIALGELPEGTWYMNAAAVSGSGVASAVPGTTVLRVDKTDPAVHLDGVPSGWSSRPLALTATAADAASGMAPVGGGAAPFTAISVDGGAPTIAAGSSVSATLIDSGAHTVAYYARDAAGNVADGGAANGLQNRAPATALIRIDREPPVLAFAGAQNPRDPELIEAFAADPLSGLDRSHGSIGVRPLGSHERFAELPTEASGGKLRARWDSDAYPPGAYEFRAVGHDLAGNSASTMSRSGGAPMWLQAPLKVTSRLTVDLGSPTLRYGRGTWLRGRLLAGRRAPLAGTSVRIVERFDEGAVLREKLSTATAGPDGTFRIHLAPGPSREVIAIAPGSPTTRGTVTDPLRLTVRGHVSLRASAPLARVGGKPVAFTGKVGASGARIPTDGKVVELQFRLPGLPWHEFRTVRTNPRGHFRYPYRFADDDSRGVTFQFRAITPAQAGWPYLPAKSRPIAVLGT